MINKENLLNIILTKVVKFFNMSSHKFKNEMEDEDFSNIKYDLELIEDENGIFHWKE